MIPISQFYISALFSLEKDENMCTVGKIDSVT